MSLFPLSSPIDALRSYISCMDVEMLDLILENTSELDGSPKPVFLEKLEKVFDTFKKSGDTFLQVHHGECAKCSKHCRGFSFIGNNSLDYIDLMFDQENHKITNIYQCSDFINYNEIEKNKAIHLNADAVEDENNAFDEDYENFVLKCKEAVNGLKQYENQIVPIHIIKEWLTIHSNLNDQCFEYLFFPKHSEYSDLNNKFESLMGVNHFAELIKIEVLHLKFALEEIENSDRDLLQWLTINEDLGKNINTLMSDSCEENEFINGKILVFEPLNLYISEEDFGDFLTFENAFQKYYYEKLDEYTIYTDEEINDMEDMSIEYLNSQSLRHVLEARKQYGKRA